MPTLNIKPTHKPIKTYYAELKEYERLGEQNEGTVRAAFQGLLQHYCHQSNLTLLCEKTHYTPEKRRITPDGEVVDTFKLPYGYWEAKDTQDDLHVEANKKFAAGYPSKNIVIQSPTHALLYQHGALQLDLDITEPRNLVRVLQGFFAYQEENIAAWHTAVAEFRDTVPQLGAELATLIETERQNNPHFQEAFTRFHQQCRTSINPNLSIAAVEEMLIQHLFTPDNTARVEKQKESEMFVVIGNPPYNMGQVNANDNNRNREYETMDKRVADTYAKDSKARNKIALSDMYVKAIRWASDRIDEEGVIAKLIGQVITVSLETAAIVENLPTL